MVDHLLFSKPVDQQVLLIASSEAGFYCGSVRVAGLYAVTVEKRIKEALNKRAYPVKLPCPSNGTAPLTFADKSSHKLTSTKKTINLFSLFQPCPEEGKKIN